MTYLATTAQQQWVNEHWQGKQTCPPPSGKNLEIPNLEFGKVVLQEEEKIHQMFQISKCKDFALGLLVLKVSYHFKAGVYVANIDPQSMF